MTRSSPANQAPSTYVLAIYSTPRRGAPAVALERGALEPGRGLVGDRYYLGTGTLSRKLAGRPCAELTLIESEEIERFNRAHGLALGDGALRRNIVTRGVRLNELVGMTFSVGEATLEGVRLCEPCAYLAKRVTQRVLPGLIGRGGLRARVVTGGHVRPGDAITLPRPD